MSTVVRVGRVHVGNVNCWCHPLALLPWGPHRPTADGGLEPIPAEHCPPVASAPPQLLHNDDIGAALGTIPGVFVYVPLPQGGAN